MDANQQHLYYTLGQLAYAFAKAENQLSKAEKEKLCKTILEGVKVTSGLKEMIQGILQKEKKDFDSTYNWAILSFKLGRENLSDEMKKDFVSLIKKVSLLFPPSSNVKQDFIKRFEKDLSGI